MTVVSRLAESIRLNGLLNPIVVLKTKKGFVLISGYHRVKAYESPKLKEIEAMITVGLNEVEQNILQLEENIARNQFDSFMLGRLVKELESQYQLESKIEEDDDEPKKKGRKKGSTGKTAKKLGINLKTIQRAKKFIHNR